MNESCKGILGGSHVCFHPTSPSLQTSMTSKVLEKDGSQANGSQNIFHNCITTSFKEQQEHSPKSCCIELQENEKVGHVFLFLPSTIDIVVQDLLNLSQLKLPNSGFESGKKSVMGMSKISMMSTNESSSSSSYGWTLASMASSKLLDATNDHQELCLNSKPAAVTTKDEKIVNTSQHVEFVVLVGLITTATSRKITKEQFIKTVFLTNLGYHHAGKEITLRCASSHDIFQQPHGGSVVAVSINGKTNGFHSKSI